MPATACQVFAFCRKKGILQDLLSSPPSLSPAGRINTCAPISSLVCALILAPQLSFGATTYRIGGDAGASDVHLPWTELATGFGGGWETLDIDESGIAPIFLTPDRNFALDALDRGLPPLIRKPTINFLAWASNPVVDSSVDGDAVTVFAEEDLFEDRLFPRFLFDLGGRFPINRIVFYPRSDHQDRFVENFRVYVYDGDPVLLSRGSWTVRWDSTVPRIPDLEMVHEEPQNRNPHVDVTLPLQQITHVLLDIGDPTVKFQNRHFRLGSRPWEIAEFEIYGDGYPPEASYTSRILDLGSVASLGDIRWTGSQDAGARVTIRTRSGSDDDPNRYWRRTGRGDEISFRDESGRPLTRLQYQGLLLTEQEGTTHDRDNWSFWSAPYAFGDSAGTAIASPGPNRYMQLDVQFDNAGTAGGGLSSLEFDITTPPVVQQVVGEVWPVETVAGVETDFVYAFKPTITSAEPGFDRFVLSTPGELTGIDSVHVNSEGVSYELSLDELPGQRVELTLPRMEAADSQKLVEVFFRARVFRFGTVFDGELLDSERPGEVGQAVLGGDAIFRIDSNQISVGINLSAALLREVRVTSPVVTPNGDGVNDEVGIRYVLLQLTEGQAVTVDVYDLNGRLVRRVYEGLDTSGRHEQRWDGRGESGALPPGLYVYRVTVGADARRDEKSGVLGVAY